MAAIWTPGARDIARVLDSRIRRTLKHRQPTPPGPWTGRVPAHGPASLTAYLRELATLMDDRATRLGEHAARTQPLWARQALGPLPEDPAAALDWQQRAAVIAAYRERYGHDHPADPIGPEPARVSPEARAAWHGALAAAGQIDGIDLRHLTDGDLWLRRGTYERETAWAPPHVAADLQIVRTARRDSRIHAVRASHEARTTRNRRTAARHREQARTWQRLEHKASQEEKLLSDLQKIRNDWEQITEPTRRVARAADTELRRRHPRTPIPPLFPHPAEATQPRRQLPAQRLTELGLTPDTAADPIPAELLQASRAGNATRQQLDELASLRLPAGEHDLSPGLAWPAQASRDRAAVRQPPPAASNSLTPDPGRILGKAGRMKPQDGPIRNHYLA